MGSMFKKDLWCGYCGTREFKEVPDARHPGDSRYSIWSCIYCSAEYEDNPGYGYFTTSWGSNKPGTLGKFCLNSGELLDKTKLPRTPEGMLRHSRTGEELEEYLSRTQIK